MVRILTVTADANLAVGLSLRCGDGVEVETVRGVADIQERGDDRFDVALIALQTAARGILAAGVIREHIDRIPCVVVANTLPSELPAGVTALKPPFDLDAITDELERAVREAESATIRAAATAEARTRAVPIERAELDVRTSAMRSSPPPVSVPTPPPSEDGPATSREPLAEAPADTPDTSEPGVAAAPDRELHPAPELDREPDHGPDSGPDSGLDPERELDEEPTRPERGWSRRERLDRGLVAANELQRLVDEMPQLNDRHAIADALVHEITDGLEGVAAVLWGPDGAGGYEALAWDGVPGAVADRRPATSQPLLRDAIDGHAVFHPPEERRPGYLDGLPGLRGGTVMAAALRADGEMHGVVVVSGGSPAEEDLIGVCALADEHAMAMAIGAHLELLRHRPAVDLRERWQGRLLG